MKIYVIGAGGVGSWLLPSLCLLEDNHRIMVVDGDTLEKKNLNRQLFDNADIGKNKAEALAEKYDCDYTADWFSAGTLELDRGDWLIVCVDNHRARLEALQECDSNRCNCIIAANETFSAEAYYYQHDWKGTLADPRVYYPEIVTDASGDPRARAIGCTGEAQVQNRQLVSANFMAAALAQHLYVLWGMELQKIDGWSELLPSMPFKLVANMTRLETHLLGNKHTTKGQTNGNVRTTGE